MDFTLMQNSPTHCVLPTVATPSVPGRYKRQWLRALSGMTFVFGIMAAIAVGIGIGWIIKPTHKITTHRSFLLIGDSLTQYGGLNGGWATRLSATYNHKIDVHNRGRAGFNTNQTLTITLPAVSHEFKGVTAPVFITVWLGANDAALANGSSHAQHIPIDDDYKTNLQTIIHQLRQLAPFARILLISPPVVDDDARRRIQAANSTSIDRTNEQAGLYAAACGEVATTLENTPDRVTFFDMYTYLMTTYPQAKDRAALLVDGLHFNDQGNIVVYEQVRKQIEALLPPSVLGN